MVLAIRRLTSRERLYFVVRRRGRRYSVMGRRVSSLRVRTLECGEMAGEWGEAEVSVWRSQG